MDITNNEIKKIRKVLEILNFKPDEIDKAVVQIEKIMTAKIFTEVLERKNFKPKNKKYDFEEVRNFLDDNYSKDEMAAVVKEVGTEFIANYFSSILKNVSEDKFEEIKVAIQS